mmetsp:Transcript_52137/g.84254  ORF Transcript_52137/g.84254 Transcript_52137/m.84254 type:complete len:109 (-) Transcript_52137:2-328(-)
MRHLESLTLPPEDCAVDVICLCKLSRESSRHSLKHASSLHNEHRFGWLSDKALQTHATATFQKIDMLATTLATSVVSFKDLKGCTKVCANIEEYSRCSFHHIFSNKYS